MKFDGQAMLGYRLQAVEQNTDQSIPITTKDLEQWLAELPLLNTDLLAQTIPEYIQQLNQVKITDKERFQILEMLRQIVEHIYRALSKKIRGANLNLSEKIQQTQWLLNVLLGEMGTGYQRLLFNKAHHSPHWFNRKVYAMLAERASYYLGEQICLAYQFCSVVPDYVWLDLNSTWQYVQTFKLDKISIEDEYAFYPDNAGTIATIYKRILLLSMVSPYSLRSAELEQLYFGLAPWVDDIQLYKVNKQEAKKGFYILLSEDQGARYLDEGRVNDGDVYLDTEKLQQKLSAWLETGKKPERADYKGMGNNLLAQVVAKLNGSLQRKSERIANPGEEIDVVIGLKNIDILLQMLQLTVYQDILSPVEEDSPQSEQLAIISDWEEYEEQVGLHYYAHEQQEIRKPQPPEIVQTEEVKRYSCTIVNESERGVCLRWHGLEDEGLFIGQLLFMHSEMLNQWTLGIVRWMCHDHNKLEAGVYLLSVNVERVTVKNQDRYQQQEEIPVLRLGEWEHQEPSLLLPRTEFKTGDELELEYQGEQFSIVLGDSVWHSDGYAQFCYQIQ